MVGFAEGLPVVSIPEKLLIAFMWPYVVNHSGWGYSPILLAHDAEGMAHEVGLAGLLPSGVVAAFSS
jgi:hypothetical protein